MRREKNNWVSLGWNSLGIIINSICVIYKVKCLWHNRMKLCIESAYFIRVLFHLYGVAFLEKLT